MHKPGTTYCQFDSDKINPLFLKDGNQEKGDVHGLCLSMTSQ